VLNRVEFCVIDKRSQQDITRPVLLQVIAEQEQRDGTILSQDFLAELIRSHDVGIEGMLSSYLEQILRLFLSEAPPAGDPVVAASQLAMQNYQRWHGAQEEIFRTLIRAANASPP
jgi:polyhydroxyalkanoate synthesis repressor PhaR